MASIILGVVGGAIGFYASGGNPAAAKQGAMLGWSIGTTVGAMIDQSHMHYFTSDMGKTNDLRVTVASYGTSIPQCWGRTKIPGIVIWGTDLVEHEQDTSSGGGGSGGPTVTTRVFTYTVSFAMAVCKGSPNTLNTVKKIYADDVVVYDSSQPSTSNVINPRFYQGTEVQTADPLIISTAGNTSIPAGSDNPAFRGLNYMVIQDMVLTNFGNRIPNFSIELDTGDIFVSDIIKDIVRQVGIDPVTQLDVTQVTTIKVTGMTIASRIDGKSSIQPLLDVYSIDLIDVDGIIRAVPRGGNPVATLTFDDLGAQIMGSGNAPSSQRVTKSRAGDLQLPKRVDVGYYSPTIDLQQATQSAVRQSSRSQVEVSVSYPMTLGDTEASQLAQRILYLAWVERNKYSTSSMPKWAELCPSDIVWLQTDKEGTVRRARLLEAEAGQPGEIRMKLVEDDDAILTQTTIGTTPTGGLPTTTPVPTDFFAWSGKELRDTDGVSAGFNVAARGSAGWQGCIVLMSTDLGATYTPVGTVSGRAVFGSASTVLGDTFVPNGNGFDVTNTVRVSVNGSLASTSEDQVLTGQGNYGVLTQTNQSVSNASDYEILGFAGATLVSAGVYDISDILRHRRTTIGTGHTNTDIFIQLSTAIQRIQVASSLVGRVVKIKCVSPLIDPSTVTAQDVLIATPTAPYAGTGDAGAAASAVQTPYFRVRGYLGQSPQSSLDGTYFLNGEVGVGTAGINHPSGVHDKDWEESSLSPRDIHWRLSTTGADYTMWLRIIVKNPTGANITFNWWSAICTDTLRVRLNGVFIADNETNDHSGTATIPAGATQLLEIFYASGGSGAYSTIHPGEGFFETNLLKKGCTWLDAGI